jgi:hypothetical protein
MQKEQKRKKDDREKRVRKFGGEQEERKSHPFFDDVFARFARAEERCLDCGAYRMMDCGMISQCFRISYIFYIPGISKVVGAPDFPLLLPTMAADNTQLFSVLTLSQPKKKRSPLLRLTLRGRE